MRLEVKVRVKVRRNKSALNAAAKVNINRSTVRSDLWNASIERCHRSVEAIQKTVFAQSKQFGETCELVEMWTRWTACSETTWRLARQTSIPLHTRNSSTLDLRRSTVYSPLQSSTVLYSGCATALCTPLTALGHWRVSHAQSTSIAANLMNRNNWNGQSRLLKRFVCKMFVINCNGHYDRLSATRISRPKLGITNALQPYIILIPYRLPRSLLYRLPLPFALPSPRKPWIANGALHKRSAPFAPHSARDRPATASSCALVCDTIANNRLRHSTGSPQIEWSGNGQSRSFV